MEASLETIIPLGVVAVFVVVRGLRKRASRPLNSHQAEAVEAPSQSSSPSPKDPGDSWIGKTVGQYLLQERLGEGGMAVVYKACKNDSKEPVAIKLIQKAFAQQPDFKQRFEREIKVCQGLVHPNIVQLVDWGEQDGYPFLAMEFVGGQSFSEQIRPEGRQLGEVFPYIAGLLDGLTYAHGLGVVHRDLKPDNIMITPDGSVKIMDFGLARSEEVAQVTKTGQSVGTPSYFPPEQLTGASPSPFADQYSLGVILYELLAGCRPFRKKKLMEILYQHLSEVPADPREHNPNLHPTVSAIVLRMLEKNPEARFPSLEIVKEGLQAAVSGQEWELPGAAPAEEVSSPAELKTVSSTTESGEKTSEVDNESTMEFQVEFNPETKAP